MKLLREERTHEQENGDQLEAIAAKKQPADRMELISVAHFI